jgi:hypothetical protein
MLTLAPPASGADPWTETPSASSEVREVEANRRWLPWAAVAAIVVVAVIGFSFFVESIALGGDALNGRVVDGHYFVASHGSYTEVTADQWNLSRLHGIAMFISFPIGMVSMAYLLFRYVFPFLMTGRVAGPASPRVAVIEGSGAPVWSGSPGGVMGGVNFTMAMLDATVYPGGIVAKPRFMTPVAIAADEIRAVRFGRRIVTSTIEVDHAGIEVASPLVLYGGRDSPLAQAIAALTEGRVRTLAHSGPDAAAKPAAMATTSQAAKPTPPGPMRAMSILGLVVAAGMVVAGLVYVIPTFGPIGVVWTAVLLVILVVNGRRIIRRGW